MGWIAAAIVGSSLLGSRSADKGADAQIQAAREAAASQERMFNKQVQLQAPWRQAGMNALNKLGTGFTGEVNLNEDPGYAFRLSEGQKALDRQAAARGGLISGGALKAAERYGQDMGSQEYQNAFNRALTRYNTTAALAGVGQTATNALTGAAGDLGNVQANSAISAGNARASGYMGQANALTSGLGTYLNYSQNQAMMNALNQNNVMAGLQTPEGISAYFGGVKG